LGTVKVAYISLVAAVGSLNPPDVIRDPFEGALMTTYGFEMIAPSDAAGVVPRMDTHSVAPDGAGKSNGSSPGSTTTGASSHVGSAISRITWAWCSSPAPNSASGICEMTSRSSEG
jgi:hypothetical protein